ncbi:hypothetical protein [Acetobacter malorum]|uniref:hypothetical protein n=1 Tax=Acetobacter malorum TaxID=178901 RepID=UPI0012E8AABC|nr:hypothetical protein [Acetobacter malorum]
MGPFSPLPRPAPGAEAFHPAFARLLRACPSRTYALQAARLALLPPPEPEEVIARNGHALFLKLTPSLPTLHRERGAALEEAFRPFCSRPPSIWKPCPRSHWTWNRLPRSALCRLMWPCTGRAAHRPPQ